MTGRPGTAVDATALRTWLRRSVEALGLARAGVDAINVFPVADGDTGTNLLVTVRAAAAAADRHPGADVAAVARAAADGSLEAAQGSSGVIISRFLHGWAAGLGDGEDLPLVLAVAADAAYAAVSEPLEGTILSVAKAAAKAAQDAGPTDPAAVARAAVAAARAEVDATTARLPALAAAGVVDAGGEGLLVVLEALADTLAGVTTPPVPHVPAPPVARPAIGSPTFAYEVQYLLDGPAEVLPALRDRLGQLGDSVAVVSGSDVHNVHVHVDDVGAAIEAGIDAGRPHRISVTRFADQASTCSPPVPPTDRAQRGRRVVACTSAGGLASLFETAGATVVEVGGDEAALEAAVVAAALAPGVTSVVVLPNARGLKPVAETAAAAARAAGCHATVVPTRSPVQGLAALAVHDDARRAEDDVVAMSAAAAGTRYGEVTRSRYDAFTSAGPCRSGDVLGLIDDDVAVIGADVAAVARELIDRLLIGGGELVTIVVGADAPTTLGAHLADYVHATRPAVEVVVHVGGQPTFPVMLGVE